MHEVKLDEIKELWSNIWEEDDSVKESWFEEYILDYKLNMQVETVFVLEDEFKDIISRLPNWKAAGPGRIFNFFIKKMTTLHKDLYKIVRRLCLEQYVEKRVFYNKFN